jgi:hypothetical protein
MNFLNFYVIFEASVSCRNMTISPLKIYLRIFYLAIDLSHSFIQNGIYLWVMKSNSAPFRSPQFALAAHR